VEIYQRLKMLEDKIIEMENHKLNEIIVQEKQQTKPFRVPTSVGKGKGRGKGLPKRDTSSSINEMGNIPVIRVAIEEETVQSDNALTQRIKNLQDVLIQKTQNKKSDSKIIDSNKQET